ncbi:unnamed protein product [Spirodela intermedia]|uniref:AAA+ ATPase domain-containing protein n=1 Tax=Spirodela intermedia TaxID=51605 RepID=A0A7I8L043_SPIIN|nr:unnamed protein product [Spirodela intermedia]
MLRFSLPPTLTAAASPQGLPLHLAAAASPRHSSRHRYRCPSSPCALSALSGLPLRPLWCAQPKQDSAPAVADDGEDGGLGEELHKLLALLPEGMRERVGAHPELHQLVEIVMDLGRRPLARFPSGDFVLSDNPITLNDLHHAISQVGDFTADNRAGISRTLHRISAIRNRKGVIVGLTCRVGRAVAGSANLLRDLIEDGASLLLIGPPGVGKTTIIRDVARMLADDFEKRVMIVDTSNEIGGDGDVPHAGIGSARRMQVPNPDMQHKVLIEAVENHMPQVIVIDEIGTRLEATAASTIAQRGIQLVATAHGGTIENLTMNPSLEMLVGGIQNVTLGDDEASRRGVQKTVLERKGPSTFTCGVEIVSKTEMRVHHSLEATVDALLSGRTPMFEIRKLNSHASKDENLTLESEGLSDVPSQNLAEIIVEDVMENDKVIYDDSSCGMMDEHSFKMEASMRMFAYGILEISVVQAIKKLGLDEVVQLTDNISEADAFLALHSKLKKNPRIQAAARSQGIPIYVTKTSSLLQITKALRVIVAERDNEAQHFQAEDDMSSVEKVDALEEARLAIEQVVIPKRRSVDLLPRPSHIIVAQMGFIGEYKLLCEKVGQEPNIHLRILPTHTETTSSSDGDATDPGLEESDSPSDPGSPHSSVVRLPLLPE